MSKVLERRKLGKNFAKFTIAPEPHHEANTTLPYKGTRIYITKATKNATWVRLMTNNAEEYIEGDDYLYLKRRNML